MDKIDIQVGETILLLWASAANPEDLKSAANTLTQMVGNKGKVQLENIERIFLSKHQESSFDAAISGFVQPSTVHKPEILAEIVRVLKPGGRFLFREACADGEHFRTPSQTISALKLAGFIATSDPMSISLCDSEESSLKSLLRVPGAINVSQYSAKKPNYEVGSSSQLKLSFTKKIEPTKVDAEVAKVWSLSSADMMDDDIEIMDSDDLLDAADLLKPDPDSLRVVCGDGTKKKKACKNCTCGLAEELAVEGKSKPKENTATSACGSCYLGDAFRCASCPYLGMPAFKPGEKIALTERQLKGDL